MELVADGVESISGYKPDSDTVAAFLKRHVQPNMLPSTFTPGPTPRPAVSLPSPALAIKMAGPEIGFMLGARLHPARNACDVLIAVFEALQKRDPTFHERFASLPKHGRTRRYLARKPDELYPGRPDLAAGHSRQLSSGSWISTNHSKDTIDKIIRMASDVAGLSYGEDLQTNLGG